MLKTYCVESQTNYNLMVHIVNVKNKEEAVRLAKEDGAWDGCDVHEIDLSKSGVVHSA